jgi:hypothetical protein
VPFALWSFVGKEQSLSNNDIDRKAILQRRAAMIAATVASLGMSEACKPDAGLSVTNPAPEDAQATATTAPLVDAATPAACLSIAMPEQADAGPPPRDAAPKPCLGPMPARPRPCLSPLPPPQPCLKATVPSPLPGEND